MTRRPRAALITGFEPFGGYASNPSADVARHFDKRRVGGVPVIGRVLPVDMAALDAALAAALHQIDPVAVILLGLAPGESVIRLERAALNLADFRIPDNAGAQAVDRALAAGSPAALWTRLPLRAIQAKLLAAGIPARLSETAGTYLCNAAMYAALARLPRRVPCGFIHLPLSPGEVAGRLIRDSDGQNLPSMALSLQRRAVELALLTSLAGPAKTRRPKA
jgi:pyroglutamyl-peptidase